MRKRGNQLPYEVGNSQIHGTGLFATGAVRKGEILPLPLMRDGFHPPYFNGLNHSDTPNVKPLQKGLRALRAIKAGEELTKKYTNLRAFGINR